ncbi:MAG: PD-(D/E)XK nuclease family transposase, partial [Myxococcales bacterium]|nr:PD-(D/E)XK nuclease family transposase [Myxococcales bacterium]
HDHTPFGDEELLEIHLLELPLLDAAPDDLLHYWVRFLRTVDPAELESLAKEHPIMAEAKEALERLSADPAARALYEARLKQRLFLETVHEVVRAEGRAQGLAEGLDRGLAEGLAKGRVEAIVGMCELLAIPVDEQLHSRLARAELTELDAILTSLRTTRTLPT